MQMSASHEHDQAPPSPAASDESSVSTGPPLTPPLSTSLPMPTFMNFTSDDTLAGLPSLAGAKRTVKSTRRVNTAERRATHNAVERARRETLNGRFLDLAALLPNLNTIRRPSKSAIVNSSIAHLNASRRHRILAAQQLRLIKEETDALRHEINQWRARAGATCVEEPVRSDAFGIVLSGELEFEQSDLLEASEEAEEDEFSSGSDGVYGGRAHAHVSAEHGVYAAEDEYVMQHAHAKMLAAQAQAQMHPQPPFSRNAHRSAPSASSHALPPQGYSANYAPQTAAPHYYPAAAPAIMSPALAAAYENPAVADASYDDAAIVHPTPVHPHWATSFEKQQQLLHSHPHAHAHSAQPVPVQAGW